MKKRRGRPPANKAKDDGGNAVASAARYNYKSQPSPSIVMLTEALQKLNNRASGSTAKYTVSNVKNSIWREEQERDLAVGR